MEIGNQMELVGVKNVNKNIVVGWALLSVLSGCTVYDREGEWTEWEESEYEKTTSYDVVDTRLSGAIGYQSVDERSTEELSRGLNPRIDLDVDLLCDIETTRVYKRSKEREVKTHYPFVGEDPDDFFDVLGSIIGYPFNVLFAKANGWQYNSYDTSYTREEREENENTQEWVEPSTLDRDRRPAIEIPELELTQGTKYDDDATFHLSSHVDRMLELDALTVRVVGSDVSQTIPLAEFQVAERARRAAVEQAKIAEAERIAAEKAAAIAAAEAAERARQERIEAFAKQRADVQRLVKSKNYTAALAAQRELIAKVKSGDTDYGVTLSTLASEGLRIAGELGDFDAVSEFMEMESH